MRLLAVAVLFAFVGAVPAADDKAKPEDKAKAAAVAFLKAVKAKDLDAAMKLADVPFAVKDDSLTVIKKTDELKAWMKDKFAEIKDADKIPTEVKDLLPFATVKEMIKDEKEKAQAEEIIGKDGFVAFIESADGKKVAIGVRMKDGKPKVVAVIVH